MTNQKTIKNKYVHLPIIVESTVQKVHNSLMHSVKETMLINIVGRQTDKVKTIGL